MRATREQWETFLAAMRDAAITVGQEMSVEDAIGEPDFDLLADAKRDWETAASLAGAFSEHAEKFCRDQAASIAAQIEGREYGE